MAYLLTQLLTHSARNFPDREALRFEGRALTYAEVDAATNQIARALQAAGVRPGDRVGFYVHKSFASVLSVFGIMKAGGVYVPLDPKSPPPRLAYITRNCGIRTLLTSTGKLPGVRQILGEESPLKNVILLDGEAPEGSSTIGQAALVGWAAVTGLPAETLPDPGVLETDLAYILYTSGSTGDPKGVMIAHRTILTFINWCVETFRMTENDRVTSHAPLHFDLSTFDLYATIKAGGTVILVTEALSIFPSKLASFLAEERVTMIYMVPSILSMLVTYGNLADVDLSSLRTVLFAGEVFPIKYLRQLAERIPHPDYYNLYGPTETNVCTYYRVRPEDLLPDQDRPVPIGIACENMGIFVLDEDGEPVTQPGMEGELWARGACVAQGYWGDPERTAARFTQNPLNPHFRETVFRTGDIVALDEDGSNWRFIGRRDHMIKSRGYRIELGEIEAALYNHPEIKEAVVLAVPDPLVNNRLKALVVRHAGSDLAPNQVRAHCSRHVPNYMVPEEVELLDSLPKTSTGKIDRTMLLQREIAE